MLSAFKNFLITLLIAAALFGVIAYFATQFVTATVSDIMDNEEAALESIMTQDKDPETDASGETLPEGDTAADSAINGNSFSFVIVTTGYRPELFDDYTPSVDSLRNKIGSFQTAADSFGILSKSYRSKDATAILLIRVDKDRRQVTYTYITPETRVFTSTGYHTLGDVHRYYGYQRVGEYVTSLTGIAVDYTFLMDGYNFDEFISLFGTVWVNNPKDIYAEGNIHTTRSEKTRVRKNADGSETVDHYENSLVLSAGSLEFNQYSSNILNTMKERSSPDIEAKGIYTVSIAQSYMAKLAGMDQNQFRAAMQGALIMSDKENAVKTWLSNGSVRTEPATPVFESNFTVDDIDKVFDLIHATSSFSTEIINYPGNYVTATANVDAYFNPDLKSAIKTFLPYRYPVKEAAAAVQ
ncbi:MAG: hypothetical protein E7631_11410 [Ruminococcaceae bacterium]|nr:hypothetical protein [Oscillospiraceae bacterium]